MKEEEEEGRRASEDLERMWCLTGRLSLVRWGENVGTWVGEVEGETGA